MTAKNDKDVEISIQQLLNSLQQSPSNPCIRKVPEYMAKGSPCYEPSVVSIGPLYYNTKPSLKLFQETKVRHLQCFIELSNDDYDLGEYIDIVRKQEDRIRSYYEEKSSLSSNEFIEMVLIDAAFIIIFFMWPWDKFPKRRHPIDSRFETSSKVQQDLFLVANQLPFFVLKELYDKAFGLVYPNTTFKDLICMFISCSFLPGREVADTISCREKMNKASNIKHLVHFLRICCLPTKLRDDPSFGTKGDEFPKLTVKELKAAGVEFRESESKNLLDITFSKGVLQIPKLVVQDTTEEVLRNIIFYEQCRHFDNSYIIDYLFFIDALIDTPEDVQILCKKGIIEHWLGSDEKVANLINQITKDVTIKNPGFYYANHCKDLNAYADTRWNKWMAVLRRDYFNHPWSVISMIYLVVLLILTVLQVYTGFKE